jgi:hypothetical protein
LFRAEPWTRWFWQYHSARFCRTTIRLSLTVSTTHPYTKKHHPSPANSITGLPRASSPMGFPYFVGLSETHSDHSRAKTLRYLRTTAKAILTRHCDSWWVMVLSQDGPWVDMVSARGKRAVSGETHDLSEKVTPTIVWNPTVFQWIDFLSQRAEFNGTHYVTNIFCQLAVWRDTQVGKTDRKLIIHSDNARPHTAKKTLDFRLSWAEWNGASSPSTVLARLCTMWLLPIWLH